MDHFYYYLQNDYSLEWFHEGSNNVLEIPYAKIMSYNLPIADILDTPLLQRYVSYSESSTMQNYYCGNINSKYLNQDRFKNIFGTIEPINKRVHPLS